MRALVAASALALLAVTAVTVEAATPANGTLSWTHTSQSWTGAGMAGSAPATSRITCQVPAQCDDFALTINTQKNGSVDKQSLAEVKITPSAGATMYLIVYGPDCPDTGPTSSCYTKFGLDWRGLNPPNGNWVFRVVCMQCLPGSGYTAQATLVDSTGAQIPTAGSQQFGWSQTQLGAKDASGNTVSFGEPGISFDTSKDGIINTFGPTVWITRDNGKTWSLPTSLLPQDTFCAAGGSGDADALVAFDRTFYADNLCLPGVGGTSNDSFTNQSGGDPAKWTGPNLAGEDVDRQWYAVDPVHAGTVYMEYHDLEGPDINVVKSTDFGATFTCPITGAPIHTCPITGTNNSNTGFVDTGEGNLSARLLIDPTNTNRLYVPYMDNCAVNSASTPPTAQDFDLVRIHVATSTDGGATWAANSNPSNAPAMDANSAFGQPACTTGPPPTLPACDNTIAHTELTAAIDSAGNVYLSFSLRKCNETQTHLYLMSSTDHGMTWSRPAQVDQGGLQSNVFQWVAAGDPGRVALSWLGSPSADYNSTASQWSEMYAFSSNALSGAPTFTQSRVSGGKSIHNADICQAGTFCLLTSGNRDLADFQGVAVDSCGFAQAVWTDDSTGTGLTYTARQTAGPNLYATNRCPTTSPFTAGLGVVRPGATLAAVLLTGGLLVVVVALGLASRRRTD